jgi:crotonobetaine/carnitine-CoA ligase
MNLPLKKLRSRGALARGALRALWNMGRLEVSEGTLLATGAEMARRKSIAFARDWTFSELLEWAAAEYKQAPFLEYGAERISFEEMNRRSNQAARRLRDSGIDAASGVALMLSNHPRFLTAFFAVQKLGAYAVPVNTALVGEGLTYILNHSEVSAIVCDHETAVKIESIRKDLTHIKTVWVNAAEAPQGYRLPANMLAFERLERDGGDDEGDLGIVPDPESPSMLLYTSGTTGLPKAVAQPYGQLRVKPMGLLASLVYTKSDKLYTCLPLFHANALMLTTMQGLWAGIPVVLSKRFSASRFWKEIADSGATNLITMGGLIPILLKTPPSPYDRKHKVKRIVSAACPADAWVPFEQRFGVEIWEAYGAVDGAGLVILNPGTGPVGSLGKPGGAVKWKLADESGAPAAPGQPGELQVFVGQKKESKVRFWKNDKASNEKVIDGWLHTGDLMQADADGYLYFVGRNTDSMRRRGENVSAFEVEKVVDAYPDVLESAAFGVPSPFGEQDIMISVVPVEGHTIAPEDFLRFLQSRLPRFAVPSYLDIVGELPKTGTHRVIKGDLKKRGVTATTIRLGEPVRG